MKSKLIKILIATITIILLFCNSNVFADYYMKVDPSLNPGYYEPFTEGEDSSTLKQKTGKILGVINVVGVICSVIVIVVVGIKYMIGSVEEKAEYKKTILAYIIGAALLFSATTLPNILYNIGTSISSGSEQTPTGPASPGNPDSGRIDVLF